MLRWKRSLECITRSREDFSEQCVHIDTPIIQYFEVVMTIDHRPVRSNFQRTGLAWLQQVDEDLG